MSRALILFLALLASTTVVNRSAYGQPPAPVGGDMSNTTVQATGASTKRLQRDRAGDFLTPFDFGAIGDDASHPLSTHYATLAAAQLVCPKATALTQEMDWCAMQAALDAIAARPLMAGVLGSPGGAIHIPANTTLVTGTTSLVANLMSLTLVGDDQLTSAIKTGIKPWLQFGLSNGMGIGSATVASTGIAFIATEQLTLTGLPTGVCEDSPIITVGSVGPSGEILSQSVTHPGSCSAPPPNPLDYTTSGIGYGAAYNGTFVDGALTGAVLVAGTGTGCASGETLTGPGDGTFMPNGKPVVPFKLTITNQVAGVVQKGGVSIADPGAYGTPPINPVPVIGSAGCLGAAVNIAALTHSGGSLTMERLQFIADGPGVGIVKAQFNLANRSTAIRDLVLVASGTNHYFNGGFDLTSMTNAVIQRIDTNNNRTYLSSNPSDALFIVRQQNTLLGHFEHYWDHINAAVYMGGGIQYIATAQDTIPYQGLKFTRVGCGLGAHCVRLDNASKYGYGNILFDDLYATQTSQQLEITKGLNVVIINSAFGEGQTRLPTPPAQADMVVLDGVNQISMRGNTCASALTVTPSVTCFHIKGTSSFGLMSANTITNAAHVPTFNGYVFDSGTVLNQQGGDYFGSGVTPVIDNGTNNTTVLSPAKGSPCANASDLGLTASQPNITIPDNVGCLFLNNTISIPTANITMPAHPAPYLEIKFTAFNTGTTTITLLANPTTGLQVMGTGMPTSITAATPFGVKNVVNRWQRI